MAARYWVGGTGNWNDINHWSTTSGGIGGASVPTMDDDVIFDNNSGTGTITVNTTANMRDCTFAQTQLIKLANAAYPFNIFGSWTLCSNNYLNTSFTGTGYVYLKATTSVNITSNGCTMAWNRLYFDGVGGTWTNQDDMNIGGSPTYISKGTWSTNNKTISFGSITNSALDIVFTINFGSSIINARNGLIFAASVPNLIINAGTSIINITGDWCSGAWKNYNTINYTKGTYPYAGVTNFICNNFYHKNINSFSTISGDFIVNNNLVFEGDDSTTKRTLIASSVIGVPRTITCNGTITASNVDFRDIIGAGAANWDLSNITGGSGNCGGNSGITFTPAQTQYFKHTLGAVNWSDVTKWFSNYERTIQGRVPLPQDDAIFDENSFTGASTLNVNVPRIGRKCDLSQINKNVAIAMLNTVQTYGGIRFSPQNTISGNHLIQFDGHGKTFSEAIYVGVLIGYSNTFDILFSNTFAELIIDAGRKVRFTNGTTQTINKLTAIGTPDQPITIGSTTAGQRHTINYTGSEASTVEYCNISDSKVTQARRLLAKNSVNAGNNQNWGFEELPPIALNFAQVDKMYVGGSEVVSAYYGEMKIK